MQNGTLKLLLGNNDTKTQIVGHLIEQNEMSLKEIHNKISKEKNISYQATHKAVNELLKDEVLEKISSKYSISNEWIKSINNLSNNLINSNKEIIVEEDIIKQYTFDTFLEVGKFVLRFFDEIPNPNNSKGICICNHAWPLFGMSKEDYNLLKKLLAETEYYELIANETPMDKIFGKTLSNLGKKVKFGKTINSAGDVIIKGNHVLQIYYPTEFKNHFNAIYEKYKSLDELNLDELMEKFSIYKTKIIVTITNSNTIAEEYRNKAIYEFSTI